ncbi:MAG: hypothetical protein JNN15_02680, partial [Blastocatellia bacterium]|nr:hypothetical protein [Blastocatellia bacterium]
MNLLKKFKHKTQGLSNHEIAQEIKRVLKARFIHRFRRVRYKLLGTEISDRKLKASLAPDYKNDDQLLVYFKQRQTPSIFWGVERAEETAKTISEFSVTFIDETLQIADEVCNHTFYFLGHTHIYQKLDWFYDCTNGYSWPKSHYSEIVLSNAKPGSDVKIPWELARLQHAVCLGQAYCLTANEKYSQEFCLQVRSFYEENPPEVGIHWLSPMEVALRAVNLSVGFYFFRASKSFDLATLKSMLKIVFSHAKFIEENLERSVRITSNHYLSDLVGLLFIGILFPEFKRAKKWREFALSEILKEMDKQVYSDGVDWEASIGYHALVLELFLYSFLLCKVNKIDIERRYWDKLAKMFLFVKAYIKPDNTAPLIGDWDDGRVFIWKNRHTTDHSYLLSIAAIIYEDERFKVTGFPAEESIWIFGQQGYETFENIGTEQQAERSAAFPEAG